MNDLIAIATIRRLLRDLGVELPPGEVESRLGSLSQWVSQARTDLGGQSPLQILSQPDGEVQLRNVLANHLAER